MLDKFGPKRVIDAPIAEGGFAGMGVGPPATAVSRRPAVLMGSIARSARSATEPKRSSAPAKSSGRGEERSKREGDDGGDQPRGVHLRFGSRAARVWSRRRTGVVTGALVAMVGFSCASRAIWSMASQN